MQTCQTRYLVLYPQELQDEKQRLSHFHLHTTRIQFAFLKMMDEEDDDFYDPADTVPATQTQNYTQKPPTDAQAQNTNEVEEEEVEVEDDDVSFVKIPVFCWV